MKNWEAHLHIIHFKMLEFYPANIRTKYSAVTFLGRSWRLIKYFLSFFKVFIFGATKSSPKVDIIGQKYWFFISTKNQRDCLLPCKEGFGGGEFVGTGFLLKGERIHTLPIRNRWIYNLGYPLRWLRIWKKHPQHAIRYFDYLYKTMGAYECFIQHLKKYRPKAIVISNDHNFAHRSLLFAAKKLSIPTIYIQHAAVSTYFPPLHFDLSLLEGQDTLDKYKQCGPIHGEVSLVGMAKFDGYEQKRNINKRVERVGICCGPLDDLKTVNELVHRLVAEIPNVRFSFRKHPRDKREFDVDALSEWLEISDPLMEKPLDFLCEQDLIVAGNSSIHLEAILLNVESIYLPLDSIKHGEDYYGFVKNNLSISAENIDEVVKLIREKQQKKEDVYLRAKYYNHLIGTSYEGKSSQLIIQHIKDFIEKGIINSSYMDEEKEIV